MKTPASDLPLEIQSKLKNIIQNLDGEHQATDMIALINLIIQHGTEYPELFNLIKPNKNTLEEHYNQTGEVPPGIKLIRTTQEEGSNVISLEVINGRAPLK